MAPPIGIVVVTFGLDELDLRSAPANAQVVLVHNDDRLDVARIRHSPEHEIVHVRGHGNVGFGAGANLGVERVRGTRVVFCNPDATLAEAHWAALADASPDEVVSVPMIDDDGRPASVVNDYPTPLTLVLTGYRVGRLARRGSATRAAMERLLGNWGREHAASTKPLVRPLSDAWCSGAILSVDVERFRAAGGFDEGYFLYFEDTDFCRRLGERFPGMRVRVADVEPARHAVGGSARSRPARRASERHLVSSGMRYARTGGRGGHSPRAWRLALAALRVRSAWLARS